MSTTFTLSSPVSVGGLTNPVSVSTLELTSITYSSTPALAPIGTGTLSVTLTDPVSGWQETVDYQDPSVLTLWQQIGDTIAAAVFAKLIADAKIPAGTITAESAPPAS